MDTVLLFRKRSPLTDDYLPVNRFAMALRALLGTTMRRSLFYSYSARNLTVQKISQDNREKNTPGNNLIGSPTSNLKSGYEITI